MEGKFMIPLRDIGLKVRPMLLSGDAIMDHPYD